MWECKECDIFVIGRHELLKHFRLQHRNYGRSQRYPCAYLSCPCIFKTWNALHINLSRVHANQSSQEQLESSTFSCHLCTCSNLPTEKEYFAHISTHLKSNETVSCMFVGCSYKTNIYGTFNTHKNRKHTPHTFKDFKPSVVRTTESQEPYGNPGEGTSCQDDTAVEANTSCSSGDGDVTKSLPRVIEEHFAACLLKLEHIAHVSGKTIDGFLEELHYLLSSATLPLSVNILEEVLQKHSLTTDKSVITEIATALFTSNPMLKSIEKGGSLSTTYLRKQYYKESFNIVEPVEYILNAKERRSFQYVPVLKFLQNLFDGRDVVDKVVDNHRAQQTNRVMMEQKTYRSFQDGEYFLQNSFLSDTDLRILLTLYIDDFEVCNPLGTSRTKHKLCAVYWILSNLPPGSHSSLSEEKRKSTTAPTIPQVKQWKH